MKLKKYTVEQLREAVANNKSYRKILQELGVEAYGGNYDTLRKAIKHFEIDASHLTGQGWSKDQKIGPKQPLEYFYSANRHINTHALRLRLIREGVFKHQCSNCRKKKWLCEPIPLELDHIDGNNKNNSLDNLRLLCPNCHSLTPTFRGRNKK